MNPAKKPRLCKSRSLYMASPTPTTSAQKRKVTQSPSKNPNNKKAKISAADPTDVDEKENGRGVKDTFHGVIYQLKLLIYFSYICCLDDYSFKLYSEMAAAEKFDDLVLEYTKNNLKGYIFLQAKHSLDENIKITCDNLKTSNNRFGFVKYFKSYQKIKKKDQFKSDHQYFIINTNLGFKFDNISDKKDFKKLGDLYFQPFDINSNINNSNKIFDMVNVNGTLYKLKDSIETLKSWFADSTDFIILAKLLAECLVKKKRIDFHEPMFKEYHSVLVEKVIDCKNAKLADDFIKDKNLSLETQAFRETFLQEVEKAKNTKRAVFLKELESNGSLKLSYAFKIKHASNNNQNFPDQEVSVEDIKGFMNDLIFAVNQPNEKKLSEIITQKIGQDFNLISSELASAHFLKNILDWLKEKRSGFLTQDDILDILENTDVEITAIQTSGQSILFTDKLDNYGYRFEKEAIPEALLNFLKSSDQAQKRIFILQNSDAFIGSLKVSQALQEGFKINEGFTFTKLADLFIEKKMVLKAFKNNNMRLLIVVCEPTDKNVPELFNLLSELLQNPNKRLLLIGSEEHPLIERFSSTSLVVKQKNIFNDFIPESRKKVLQNKVPFQKQTIPIGEIVHEKDEAFMNLLLNSGLLENKIQNLGNEISISKGYNIKYYIERNFHKRTEKETKKPDLILIQDLIDELKADKHKKLILITDIAGMGKSTILTHISLEIKKANPHFWVERIDLNAHIKALKKHKGEFTSESVVDFIATKMLNLDEINISLFKLFLKEERFVLLLDAFDELCPTYKDKFESFFHNLKKINLRQIWITTRPFRETKPRPELSLESQLAPDQVESVALTPILRKHQIELVQKILSQKSKVNQSKLKTRARKLINDLENSIGYDRTFTRVPLHLIMIAHLCASDKSSFGTKINFDLYDLFRQFLEKKMFIYLDKCKGLDLSDASREHADIVMKELDLMAAFQHLAIQTIFPRHAKKFLQGIAIKDVSPDALSRSGIVIIKNNEKTFVHHTFAEYFAVTFIMKELGKETKNKFLEIFFFKDILYSWESQYKIIRKFINGFLERSGEDPLKNMGESIKEAYKEELQKKEKIYSVLAVAAQEYNPNIIKLIADNLNVESCIDFSKSFIERYIESTIECKGRIYNYNDESKVIDALFAWIKNLNYSSEHHPFLKSKNSNNNLWAFAIFHKDLPLLKRIYDYFKNEMSFTNDDLKNKLLLSEVFGMYPLVFASKDITNFVFKRAEEVGAVEALLQSKDLYERYYSKLIIHTGGCQQQESNQNSPEMEKLIQEIIERKNRRQENSTN